MADILKSMALTTLSLLIVGLYAYAADGVSFEVASVKVTEPLPRGVRRGCIGGPGTSNPGAWSCAHVTLSELIHTAYDWGLYQFKAPQWMTATWLAIVAKVPAATTREQFVIMQQNLLEERFKLVFHREPKEMTVYELVVGKNGLKMRETSPANASTAEVEFSIVPSLHHRCR
jgi:uncharacterized protein (TIGR03435 family)